MWSQGLPTDADSDAERQNAVRGLPLDPMGASRESRGPRKKKECEMYWNRTQGGKGKGKGENWMSDEDEQQEEYYWNRNPARGAQPGKKTG